jgi:hypothetical protein
MAQEVILHWEAARGGSARHKTKSVLTNASGPGSRYPLGQAIAARSKCKCRTSAYINRQEQHFTQPVDPESTADRRATVYFRHPSTLEVHQFSYPDPVDGDTEVTPQGERLTQAALATVVTAINTATGISYAPLYGVVTQTA